MTRVFVLSADVVGERMAGPGIRAFEFARLLARSHPVTLAVPPPVPASLPGGVPEGLRLVEAVRSVVAAAAADHDVLVVQGSALDLFPGLERSGRPLVVDLYDPYFIENLEIHSDQPLGVRLKVHDQDLAVLRQQAVAGDFFLCASERQRHLWLGVLSALNRVNPLTYAQDPSLAKLLAVVPFGVGDAPLQPGAPALRGVVPGIEEGDFVVLWGGGVWNWFDPLTLIRAVERAAAREPRLKLVFMGLQHPNASVPRPAMAEEAERLARSLGLEGRHVFFRHGWVPYAERQSFLAEADVGASLHFDNIETTFAFRTRVLDYLWAGLPMLLSAGDELAELGEREGFALVTPTGDVEAVAAGLQRLAGDTAFREACAAASRRVAERFRWSVVARPLLEFCASPYRSPDAERRALAATPGLGERGRRRTGVAGKAWRSLRHDGPRAFAARSWRYLRRRFS